MLGKRIAVLVIAGMLFLMVPVPSGTAEWSSPGDGSRFTMEWLDTHTTAVICEGDGVYSVIEDITISETDTLEINAGETVIVLPETTLKIKGN